MHITLLGLPDAAIGNLIACMEILTMANHFAESAGMDKAFAWSIATPSGQAVQALGATLTADLAMAEVAQTDLIFTPAFIGRVDSAITGRDEVCTWLRDQHRDGTNIATSCTGSFLLAQAGLLDGKRAATNWLFAALFRRIYPQVHLDEDALVVLDQGVYTTGATLALHHLLLHFIDIQCGPEIARKAGGLLLIDPNRASQAPYRRGLLLRPHRDSEIRKVEDWFEQNWQKPITIPKMASKAGLGERQFLRRFKSATGRTPLEYLQNMRIEHARNLLETTSSPVSEITWSVGYEDINTFRKLFRRSVGLTPNQYRERFNRSLPVMDCPKT
ncbi:MAG: helix-turn-helix domain-containing protein [Proteobacteria bacterium]|nr:helix-turn-helix domain-containing protein [Pseudomonadota bacterium]